VVQVRSNDVLETQRACSNRFNPTKQQMETSFLDSVGLQLGSKVASLWEPLLTSAHTKLHTTTSLVRHYATLALLGRAKFRRILKHALKKARNQKKLKLD